MFMCLFCRHELGHTLEGNACSICQKTFPDRGSLNRHLAWHAKQSVGGPDVQDGPRELVAKGGRKRKSMEIVEGAAAAQDEKLKKRRITVHGLATMGMAQWKEQEFDVEDSDVRQRMITPQMMKEMQQMAMMQLAMQTTQTEGGAMGAVPQSAITNHMIQQIATMNKAAAGQGQGQCKEESAPQIMAAKKQYMEFMRQMAMSQGRLGHLSNLQVNDSMQNMYYAQLEAAYKQQAKLMEEYQNRLLDIERAGGSRNEYPGNPGPGHQQMAYSPRRDNSSSHVASPLSARKIERSAEMSAAAGYNGGMGQGHFVGQGQYECGVNGADDIMLEETGIN